MATRKELTDALTRVANLEASLRSVPARIIREFQRMDTETLMRGLLDYPIGLPDRVRSLVEPASAWLRE